MTKHPLPIVASLTLMASLWLGFFPVAWAQQLTLSHPEGSVTFTAAEIMEMRSAELQTETPWTDGLQHFEGVYLVELLNQAEIAPTQLMATALNGYRVEIPVEEAVQAGAFIAVKANGNYMRVRDKGPFWIVFPWSQQSEIENRMVRSWAVWQLIELTQDQP